MIAKRIQERPSTRLSQAAMRGVMGQLNFAMEDSAAPSSWTKTHGISIGVSFRKDHDSPKLHNFVTDQLSEIGTYGSSRNLMGAFYEHPCQSSLRSGSIEGPSLAALPSYQPSMVRRRTDARTTPVGVTAISRGRAKRHRRHCRQAVLYQVDVHYAGESRAGDHVLSHRRRTSRTPQHGRLVELRAGK